MDSRKSGCKYDGSNKIFLFIGFPIGDEQTVVSKYNKSGFFKILLMDRCIIIIIGQALHIYMEVFIKLI